MALCLRRAIVVLLCALLPAAAQAPQLVLSPNELLITYTQGATPDSAVVSVSAKNTTTPVGALSLSGVPAWLSATASAANKTIVNRIKVAEMTVFGSYDATITVSDAGTGLQASYLLTVNYRAPEVNPITIAEPTAATRLKVGDTLKVLYSADCTKLASVTVDLTVNGGDSWFRLHQGNSIACGPNQVVVWKTTDSITVSGGRLSTLSTDCRVKVEAYNSPGYAVSGTFVIEPAAAAQPRPRARRQGIAVARFLQARNGRLTVLASTPGTVAVTDLRGRAVARQEVTSASTAIATGAPGYRAVTFAAGSGTRRAEPEGSAATVR